MSTPYSQDETTQPQCSHLIISSLPAGQMTLPLLNQKTGEVEQYMLVKMQSESQVHSPSRPDRLSCSNSIRQSIRQSYSEGSSPSDDSYLDLSLELGQYLQRLDPKDSLMNVSFGSLNSNQSLDRGWTPSPERQISTARPGNLSSPSPKPKIPIQIQSRSSSTGGTPSLLHESMPSLPSSASLNPASPPQDTRILKKTPSPLVHRNDASHDSDPDNTWPNVVGSGGAIGLGIIGLLKDDGTQFDGLGILPNRPEEHSGTTIFEDHWGWTREDQGSVGTSSASSEDTEDYEETERSDMASFHSSCLFNRCPPPGLESAFSADTCIHTENPPQPAKPLYIDTSNKKFLFDSEEDDDVFFPRSVTRSNPALAINGVPLARRSRTTRNICRPTITSSLKGPTSTSDKEHDCDRRPVWRP